MNAAFDPANIPKSLTPAQLEWFVLFGICVAGKNSQQTEKKLNDLLTDFGYRYLRVNEAMSPFWVVRAAVSCGYLGRALRKFRMGQYKRINKAFRKAIQLDLSNPTVEMFESVPGIGPKTARMIMLYYAPKANCVPLDTHILKYLKKQGISNVPKSTPAAGPTYARLERAFQRLAAIENKSVRELDTEVWTSYANRNTERAQ